MVNIFNETICNVLNNYISHKTIICEDKEPSWINSEVKKALQVKNRLFTRVKSNINNCTFLEKLQYLQNELNDLIDTAKRQYYKQISIKLMDPTTSAKTYWSILKRCLNDKKIPCIPPLFHDSKFITNFREKAELFISFFWSSVLYSIMVVSFSIIWLIILTKNYLISYLIAKKLVK